MLNQLPVLARTAGIDPVATIAWCRGLPRYLRDVRTYRGRHREVGGAFPFSWRNAKPFLADFASEAGVAGGHYFFQDLWAARLVFARRPARHVDIASRLDGFVAHLLTFMPVEVIDVRPLTSVVPGLTFIQDDATDLRGFADGSVATVSPDSAADQRYACGMFEFTKP